MKRLVYSPKAYAFVRTDDHGIINLSDYIVSGSVTRRVNMVSSAELTFRNPDMKWTSGARSGKPIFRPMDLITIYLERIPGCPIQVFTGYLDTVPYLQLFPGTCRLTASCTLKRLQHTYWDPALDFVIQFMHQYGWVVDRQTGVISNPTAEKQLPKRLDDKLKLTDGSIGSLLFAVLVHVGEWGSDDIRIADLPPDILDQVVDIYEAFTKDSEEIRERLTPYLKALMGDGKFGDESASGTTTGESSGGTAGSGGLSKEEMEAAGRGEWVTVGATVFNDAIGNKDNKLANTKAYAELGVAGGNANLGPLLGPLFGFKNGLPQDFPIEIKRGKYSVIGFKRDVGSGQGGETHYKIDLHTDLAKALHVSPTSFKGNVQIRRADKPKKSRSRSVPATTAQVSTGGRLKTNSDSGKDRDRWTYPLPSKRAIGSNVSDHMARAFGNWMSDNAVDIETKWREKILAVEDGTISRVSGSWRGVNANPNGYTVYLRGKSGNEFSYMHMVQTAVTTGQKVKAGHVLGYAGAANGVNHLHFAAKPPLNPETVVGGGGIETNPSGGSSDNAGTGTGGGTVPWESLLSASKAAAFVQQMEFPGVMEQVEAMTLTGDKSLLNDKPLLPFIEQLTKASMRSFMSLPDGRFYAFYPDYFGNAYGQKPYWYIDDVEVLDAQINLNDDALATHVFAVGDTNYAGSITEFDRLTTTGVINIFNVTQSGLTPTNEEGRKDARDRMVDKPKAVLDFLQKYGARPHLEEEPLVRNSFYEAFLAYMTFQRLWASQFLTEFQLTFMPELYPGGLVGFPSHGVQCYIDEVTHTFDYESGFMTTTNLSSPATLTTSKVTDDPLKHGLVRAGR